MLRKNFFIREDQDKSLKTLRGSESEHVRNAIDEYLDNKKLPTSESPSIKEENKE